MTLVAGRQLDRIVAEQGLGWKRHGWLYMSRAYRWYWRVPKFSTVPEDAWLALMVVVGTHPQLPAQVTLYPDGRVRCQVEGVRKAEAEARTLPLAICGAVLRAAGQSV